MKCPNFQVVLWESTAEILIIRDVGPWSEFPTVTNNPEQVIRSLIESGNLPQGRRLFYYDSENQLDELLIQDGAFAGFAPGPR